MEPALELSVLIAARHPQLAASSDLEQQLRALVDAARQRWPNVPLDGVEFVAHLAERLIAGDDAAAALERIHGSDLFLACACARQQPQALAAFDREYLSRINPTVARVDPSRDFVDEVRQRLRERLLVGERARIGEYSGTGPLEAWTRVAAMRVALNVQRESRRNSALRPDAGPTPDSEVDFIDAQYSPQVEAAFRQAFARLPGQSRELLRLQYVEGLTHERIAQQQQVDRSTLSRRIRVARRFLLSETRRALQGLIPALTTASRDSLLVALRSHIDLNLKSLLR